MLRVPLATYSHFPFLASIFVRRLGEEDGGGVVVVRVYQIPIMLPKVPTKVLFYSIYYVLNFFCNESI